MKTDLPIQHDVRAELRWEPSIDATRVGVDAIEGIVTLTGHVGSFAENGMPNASPSASRAGPHWPSRWR